MRSFGLAAGIFALLLPACASSPPPTAVKPPVVTSAAVPATAAPAVPATFTWATPEKWKHETIPFPLDFAPDLPYRGTEELRFAPGFFDPKADGYWSYAFVWWIESGPELTQNTVETGLRDYFVGLTRAVAAGGPGGKNKFEPDLGKIEAHLGATSQALEGTLRTIDAFKTHNEVLLNVKAKVGACGDHRFLLVSASPKPAGDPAWASLNDVVATFHCD